MTKVYPTLVILVGLAALVLLKTSSATNPPIAYLYTNFYEEIWTDRGSGAHRDVSFWKEIDYEPTFYSVGDVAWASHEKPGTNALIVKALEEGSLARPVGFTEVWKDAGSGARRDVKIFRMDPPLGYTCLGYVAAEGSSVPDPSHYRCVKSEYVTDGQYLLTWDDSGSGAHRDVAVYNDIRGDSLDGIDANTFTAFATYSPPGGQPKILDGRYAKLNSLIPHPTVELPLQVYFVADAEEIWNDRGSGANQDFSVWRAPGTGTTFSLGDLSNNNYNKPQAFLAKDTSPKKNALRLPHSYRRIWTDAGSGANWDGSFWEPLCPSGFVALGNVAMRSHSIQPDLNSIACVNGTYTIPGKWEHVWDDRGSGAKRDVSVWEAIPLSSAGFSTNPMTAVDHYDMIDRIARVLKSDAVRYIRSKPAEKYILTNVKYQFDDRDLVDQHPEDLLRTTVINRGNTPQDISRGITYEYTESYDWSFGSSLEISISFEVTAGVPLIGESTVTTGITTTFSSEVSESTSETESHTTTVNMEVQPRSQKEVIITANRYTANIPYTATLTTIFTDGTRAIQNDYKGTYRGVQVNHVQVVFEPDVPIEPGKPDPQ